MRSTERELHGDGIFNQGYGYFFHGRTLQAYQNMELPLAPACLGPRVGDLTMWFLPLLFAVLYVLLPVLKYLR